MKRTFCLTTLCVCMMYASSMLWAQIPVIKSISRNQGSLDQTVVIKGSGFGSTTTGVSVSFGATKGEVLAATKKVLVAKIPAGTTYDNIAVTNLTSGLTGYSNGQFLLNFHGDPGSTFDINQFQNQVDFPVGGAVEEGLYDLCLCDFNNDKLIDVATANDKVKYLSIYQNNATPGSLSFLSKTLLNIPFNSLQIKCADLNGDNKSDLIVSEKGTSDRIIILKNNTVDGSSSFSFTAAPAAGITLTGKRPLRIEVADLNLDGKPDIILTSQKSNTVTILKNESTSGAITFNATPVSVTIPNIESTDGLAVQDLDGDDLPEIVTNQYQTTTDIYILKNNSTSLNIAFNSITNVAVGTAVKNIKLGDIDGDGKKDIAFTQLAPSSKVGVMLNQTISSFAFGNVLSLTSDNDPWGLDFGDLDGDGKIDLAVASITRKSLSIFKNNSTPGNASFQSFIKPTTYINRHVLIGDMDNDGKPDIVFTSNDDVNAGIVASKVSILRNKNCIVPEITPSGPLHICDTNPTELISIKGGNVSYQWKNLTTNMSVGGNSNLFAPTTTGSHNYSVTATSESGSCVKTSNIVTVEISNGNAADPLPTSNSSVCVGQKLELSIQNNLGAGYSYQWTGPRGVIGEGANVDLPGVLFTDAGTYEVNVFAGDVSTGCLAKTVSTLVDVDDVPAFKVAATTDIFCAGESNSLSVYPAANDFTYQWFEKNSGALANGSNSNFSPEVSGEYFFKATSVNANCQPIESPPFKALVLTPPVVDFSAPAQACTGQSLTIQNNSIVDPAGEATYNWTTDGNTSTAKDLTYIYSTTGNFNISLTASYNGKCLAGSSKFINIAPAPTVTIANENNVFSVCAGNSIPLSVVESFNTYKWSTGETTNSISVSQPGVYEVEVTNGIGCIIKQTKSIQEFPAPNVEIKSPTTRVGAGEPVQLAANGLTEYHWTPEEGLNNPAIANPIATPSVSTLYNVSGKDENGCIGNASVQLFVDEGNIVSKLKPANFFSPNGDSFNPYWIIQNIEDYPQCSIIIYSEKGMKVYNAKPYMNDWDGTMQGRALPEGVYYYVIRCEGQESTTKSGSITLLH